MGGSCSDINDLKNDTKLREMIKSAIKGTIKESNESHEMIQKSKRVKNQSMQTGSNNITSGGGVVIGSADNPIQLTQKTNIKSVVNTLYVSGYLKKQKEPIVQIVSSDLVGLSEENANEKELQKWYDPKYVLEMLGFRVDKAEFDFDNERINYWLSAGEEAKEDYKNNVKKDFETKQQQQILNKQWNDSHSTNREYYKEQQKKLKRFEKELEELYDRNDTKELSQQLEKAMNNQKLASNNENMYYSMFQDTNIFNEYEKKYILANSSSSRDYKLSFDERTMNDWDNVINDEIYKNEFMSEDDEQAMGKDTLDEIKDGMKGSMTIFASFVKVLIDRYSGYDDNDKCDKFKNEVNNISRMTWLNEFLTDDNEERLSKKYGEDKFETFKKKIETFETTYSEYQQNIVLKAMKDIDKYTNDNMKEQRKEFIPNCDIDYQWTNVHDIITNYYEARNDVATEKIKYEDLKAKWISSHEDLKEKIEDLEEKIDLLEKELKSVEAKEALTFYEYWDTEEINGELVEKIKKDAEQVKKEFDEMFEGNEDEKTLNNRVFETKNRWIQSQNDQQLWKLVLMNTVPYIEIANEKNKQQSKNNDGDQDIQNILSEIKNNQLYKNKLKEMSEGLMKNEIESILPSEVVANIDDDDLHSQYMNYVNRLNDWRERMYGFNTIMNEVFNKSEDYKSKHGGDYKLIESNWKSYNEALNDEPRYKSEYMKLEKEYRSKYGEDFDKLNEKNNELTARMNAYQSKKGIWEIYDEIVLGTAYKWKTFDELCEILTSGYVQNINDKISNYEEKTTNIVRNIQESINLFALNEIEIQGTFKNKINVEQSINLIQELTNNIKIVSDEIDKVKQEIENANEHDENDDANDENEIDENNANGDKSEVEIIQPTNSGTYKKMYILIFFVSLFGILILSYVLIRCFRKNDDNSNFVVNRS